MNLDRRVAAANLEGLVWVHRRRSATLGGVSTFSFGSSKYRRPQAIWPPRTPCSSPRVPPEPSRPPWSHARSIRPTPPLQKRRNGGARPGSQECSRRAEPVLPDLAPAGEGSRRMGRLVTSVILIEAGKLSLQVMCIQCMERTLAHRFAKPSLPLI